MATSGTYGFNPTLAEIVIEAYDRCGIRPAMLTAHHMTSARMSLNTELITWSNKGVNLWAVELHTPIPLIANDPDYAVDAETVSILDCYISQSQGGVTTDLMLRPISRTDYANIPNKLQTGRPSCFWFERTVAPAVHLFQTPDLTGSYVLNFYRLRRLQDASPTMGQNADIIFRFVDALCAGLAERLATKFAPEKLTILTQQADMAWMDAAGEDRENTDQFLTPELQGYFNL